MEPYYGFIQFLKDKTKKIVPVSDIKNFQPTSMTDFNRKKIYKIMWPQEDDYENMESYERAVYDATVLQLGGTKDSFQIDKRMVAAPTHILESPSETENDLNEKIKPTSSSTTSESCKVQLLKTLKRNISHVEVPEIQSVEVPLKRKTIIPEVSSGDSDSDEEITVSKRKYLELREKVVCLKSKVKHLQAEKEAFEAVVKVHEKCQKNSLEGGYCNMQRDFDNKFELMWKDILEMKIFIYEQATKASTIRGEASTNSTATISDIQEGVTRFGSIDFPDSLFSKICQRKKNSLFVKDLVNYLWTDDELLERNFSGKAPKNSADTRKALTPEKLDAIEEAFSKRLENMYSSKSMISVELKQMNRFITEKICDCRKLKARKSLSFDVVNQVNDNGPVNENSG